MRKFFFTAMAVFLFSSGPFAQNVVSIDKSPMDMSYYPDNFAHDRKPGESAIIRVTYSRPARDGREIFGQLVPFHKVWRTGANEASEIKLYRDMEIGGKKIKAGTYSLFTIPDEKEWDIILSNDLDYWGAYSYNYKHDVIRAKASSRSIAEPVETFTISFESRGAQNGVMILAWDKTVVEVPFEL